MNEVAAFIVIVYSIAIGYAIGFGQGYKRAEEEQKKKGKL